MAEHAEGGRVDADFLFWFLTEVRISIKYHDNVGRKRSIVINPEHY